MVLYNQYWILDALMGDVQLAPLPIRTPIKEDFRCTVGIFCSEVLTEKKKTPPFSGAERPFSVRVRSSMRHVAPGGLKECMVGVTLGYD